MISSRSRMSLIALAAAGGGLALAFALLSRPEGLIGYGFADALARSPAAHGPATAAPAFAESPAVDPRHIHPSSLAQGPALPVLGPVKIGERVRLATGTGEQVLEVVGVHPLPRASLGTGDLAGPGLVIVTLRAEENGATVRLVVEEPAEVPLPATSSNVRRAL